VGQYDDLLDEAKSKAAAYMSTAKVYIPKMYNALMNENKNISPEDARDRIEKDCVGIWSKRTILDALPDEAKNREKQKSGRLGQKKRNFAAVSAAPEAGAAPIILDTNGRAISGATDESSEHGSKRQVKTNIKECPNCQELYATNQELKDALEKSNQQLRDALKIQASATTDKQIPQKSSDGYLEFELHVPSRPLLRYMIRAFDSNEATDSVLFTGKLNIQTRSAVDVRWFYA
jgi:hypothetical protein